jgi:16S rRNA (uracil1498-N3)-methyltransferase
MTPPLFLVAELPDDGAVRLGGDEGRHAARVKRLREGERVLVSDGRGSLLECTVAARDGDGLTLSVSARQRVPAPRPRIVVVQALPKGERAELAVEVLTELGVDEIVPWAASRSIAHWLGPRGDRALEKWRRTAREATKQSRRAWLPVIAPLASTSDVAARLAAGSGIVLHEDATEALGTIEFADDRDVVVVVGPEGGIAPDELDDFAAVGARRVRLGQPVLRTSTAGAAAVAVLSVQLGRWEAKISS